MRSGCGFSPRSKTFDALGAVLEDENELNDVESPYTETVLLQEMFNLLVTKKWIVSDAVGAFRARRRLEIESKALAARLSHRPRRVITVISAPLQTMVTI